MIGSKLILVALVSVAAVASVGATDTQTEQVGAYGAKGGPLGALGGIIGGIGGIGKKTENSLVVPTKSQEKTEVKAAVGGAIVKEVGFLGIKSPAEMVKLLLNPFEFCAKLAQYFKVSFDKFFPLVTKGVNFGVELVVQPVILSLKIVEKALVPDHCKLRFVCRLTKVLSFTKDIVPTLSDKILNESKMFKALNDGILGRDCDVVYKCNGQPKLKEEYRDVKEHKEHKDHKEHKEHKEDEKNYGEEKQHNYEHDSYGDNHSAEPIYAASSPLKLLKL